MSDSRRDQLFALSAVDGRYRTKLEMLARFVSEAGLISYRLRVEAEWLLHLADTDGIGNDLILSVEARNILEAFRQPAPLSTLVSIKDIEKTTNHDVKAVEYFLREALSAESPKVLGFIHFACTSEDINNLSYALMLAELREQVVVPAIDRLIAKLDHMALEYRDLPMLSRTHGQSASPTTLGKEIAVFSHRIGKQRDKLLAVAFEAKMSGAVGNYNAHCVAYDDLDWLDIARSFIESRLGLKQNLLTTQIENHDSMVEFTEILQRIHTICIGLCRDMWSYISIDYFKQEKVAGEVGSSTMPHKVNPIDFENAEGNFGVANALATHYSDKLPISRWQRDLSDSTVQRTLGQYFGHSLLALQSLERGLGKITARPDIIQEDLATAWEVLAEPIQTAMRRYGIADAYERLKDATRGQKTDKARLASLIDSCDELPDDVKTRLKALTPASYIGEAARLVDLHLKQV